MFDWFMEKVFLRVLLIIAFILVMSIPFIFYQAMTADYNKPYCRSGYVFDRVSGRQVIGENSGGIPCNGNANVQR